MARTATSLRTSAPYLNLTPTYLSGRDQSVYAYNGVLWSRKSANNTILQKSTDYGQSWTDVYTFTYNVGIIIVTDNGTILVGQKSDSSFFTDPPAQLYRSTDGGSTFTSVLTLTAGGFESFSFDVQGNKVIVGEYGKYNATKVYMSEDAGATWNTVFTHPVNGSTTVHIHKVHIDNTNPSYLYVSAGDNALADGVWFSTNNGQSWNVLTADHQPTWIETDADYVYLGEDLEGKIHRIAKSEMGTGEGSVVEVYDAQLDGRGDFGNISFYAGSHDNYGNIYFGGVAYGVASVQNNDRDAPFIMTHDQGNTWTLINSFPRQSGTTSSGFSVITKPQPNGYIYVRTSNSSKVRAYDTAQLNTLANQGIVRTAVDRSNSYNIVPNGDFSIYPSGTTATGGTASIWIDGTAGGSTARMSSYRWAIPAGGYAGTAEARLETKDGYRAMRLSNTNTTGAISVASYRTTTANEYFVLQPSTSYTLTGYIKTTNAVTNGAYIDVREFTNTGSTNTTRSTSKLAGTNDWTAVTLTFTTGATTKLGAMFLRLNVVGNVSDAWFRNVKLVPTSISRAAA